MEPEQHGPCYDALVRLRLVSVRHGLAEALVAWGPKSHWENDELPERRTAPLLWLPHHSLMREDGNPTGAGHNGVPPLLLAADVYRRDTSSCVRTGRRPPAIGPGRRLRLLLGYAAEVSREAGGAE